MATFAAAVPLCARAASNQLTPVTLQLHYTTGAIHRYQTALTITAKQHGSVKPIVSISEALLQQETVTKVLQNGDGIIKVQTLSGQGIADGKSFVPSTERSASLLQFSPQGEFVKALKLPAADNHVPAIGRLLGEGILSSHGVFLPNHAVHVGSSWTRQFNMRVNGRESKSVVFSRLVGFQRVGLYDTGHVHAVLSAPLAFNITNGQGKGARVQHVRGLVKIVYDANVALSRGIVVRMAAYGKLWMKFVQQHPSRNQKISTPTAIVLTIQLGSDMVD